MTSTLTPNSRTGLLDELENTHFDVVVIGGVKRRFAAELAFSRGDQDHA